MKTLGASFFFVTLAIPSSLIAQSQTETPPSGSNRAIIQSWSETNHPREARIEGDRLILPSDDRDNACAFMRVYRMKRDIAASDVTRPAGYTTCVNAARFTVKTSTKPELLREPTNR